jgi:hypothetical protein
MPLIKITPIIGVIRSCHFGHHCLFCFSCNHRETTYANIAGITESTHTDRISSATGAISGSQQRVCHHWCLLFYEKRSWVRIVQEIAPFALEANEEKAFPPMTDRSLQCFSSHAREPLAKEHKDQAGSVCTP